MERVRCARAIRSRIGQWPDDLHLLDDRAGPPVENDERQRVFVLRADVNEVNVQPIDLGDELRESLELRLALAPVVLCLPIARERLDRRELHALRRIVDGLLFGPARGRDARAQVIEIRLGGLERERPDRCGGFRRLLGRDRHVGLLLLGSGDVTKPAPLVLPIAPVEAPGLLPGLYAELHADGPLEVVTAPARSCVAPRDVS